MFGLLTRYISLDPGMDLVQSLYSDIKIVSIRLKVGNL